MRHLFPEESKCPPMSLYSDAPLTRQAGDVISNFTLGAGEKAAFVLSGLCPDGRHHRSRAAELQLSSDGTGLEVMVMGSQSTKVVAGDGPPVSLLLKLLISREHGSLIAAPTFSCQRALGEFRNWDYRYTWLAMQVSRSTHSSVLLRR